jgi:hypothetical protein
MDTPFFPAIERACPPQALPGPLEDWRIAEVIAAGGGEQDFRALTFAKAGKARERLHRFILHFHRHGGTVLAAFEALADEAVSKGFPERLGCETLSATARFQYRDFPLSNNERPGYVVALRIMRPDLAGRLEDKTQWPQALLRAGWKPCLKALAHE